MEIPACNFDTVSMVRFWGSDGYDSGWLDASTAEDAPGAFIIQWTANGVMTFGPTDEAT
jgi:hypothetical protein